MISEACKLKTSRSVSALEKIPACIASVCFTVPLRRD